MPLALTRELRVQAGTQSAFQTGVTPTIQLRGIEEMALRSKNEVVMLEDMTLGLAGPSQAVVAGIGGEGSVKAWSRWPRRGPGWARGARILCRCGMSGRGSCSACRRGICRRMSGWRLRTVNGMRRCTRRSLKL